MGHAPENSIAALMAVRRTYCKWVEYDVRLSKDKVAVLCHDATVDRTMQAHGLVSDFTAHELACMKPRGRWQDSEYCDEGITTLALAWKTCWQLGIGMLVELKEMPLSDYNTVIAQIEKLYDQYAADFFVSSFDPKALGLAKQSKLMAKGYVLNQTHPSLELEGGIDAQCVHISQVDKLPEYVKNDKHTRCMYFTWPVNTLSEYKHALDCGVSGLVLANCMLASST